MNSNYIRRIVMSADKSTRLIATAQGFAEITKNDDYRNPYSVTLYPSGGSPHYMASATLQDAYHTVKSGNPAYFRNHQWVNKSVLLPRI